MKKHLMQITFILSGREHINEMSFLSEVYPSHTIFELLTPVVLCKKFLAELIRCYQQKHFSTLFNGFQQE